MREVTLIGEVHKLQWYLLDVYTIHDYRRTPLGPKRDGLIIAKTYTEHPFGSLTEQQMATGEGIQPPTDPRGTWWLNGVIGYKEPWVKVNTSDNNMRPGDVCNTGKRIWVAPVDGPIRSYLPDDVDITSDDDGKIVDVQPKRQR